MSHAAPLRNLNAFRGNDMKLSATRTILILCCLALTGCAEQQMARQPAPRPLGESKFFPDGTSARTLVPGTVPRGLSLKYEQAGNNGVNAKYNKWAQAANLVANAGSNPLGALAMQQAESPFVNTFPFPVTEKVLKHGKKRFEIFCVVCHGYTGVGDGMVVQRGFAKPPSYHEPRLKTAPVGHFYNVITKGYGAMPTHAYLVPPEDRWAIAAYIRVLQFSQSASFDDLTKDEQQELLKKGGAAQ
jgi:mono/diheme cytochrome c family protein